MEYGEPPRPITAYSTGPNNGKSLPYLGMQAPKTDAYAKHQVLTYITFSQKQL